MSVFLRIPAALYLSLTLFIYSAHASLDYPFKNIFAESIDKRRILYGETINGTGAIKELIISNRDGSNPVTIISKDDLPRPYKTAEIVGVYKESFFIAFRDREKNDFVKDFYQYNFDGTKKHLYRALEKVALSSFNENQVIINRYDHSSPNVIVNINTSQATVISRELFGDFEKLYLTSNPNILILESWDNNTKSYYASVYDLNKKNVT